MFFKWIKQHLHVKAFFGTSPNAVQTQLWIAVIVYVLLFKLKHCYQLPQTVNEILQILSVTLLQKDPINQIFMNTSIPDSEDKNRKQLVLFDL